MPGSTLTAAVGTGLDEVRRVLGDVKEGDPLAPVTVVTPSGHAAVFLRRALGTGGSGPERGFANVDCTSLPALVRTLGRPGLATRGLRLAPAVVDRHVTTEQARRLGGTLGAFAAHPGAVDELQRALGELRKCPPVTRERIAQASGRGEALVALLDAVGRRLHDCGLADVGDLVAEAAVSAAPAATLGSVVSWGLDTLTAEEERILRRLEARPIDDGFVVSAPVTVSEVRPCADPDVEARTAVRAVIAGAENGVPLWRQAILHPAHPPYERLLRQHLDDAGVAHHGPKRPPLARSVTGRCLLDLLALMDSEWSRPQVVAWLASAPLTVGPTGPPVPAGTWDVVSAAAGVIGGRRQWRERLGRRAGGDVDADAARDMDAFLQDLWARSAPPGGSWRDHGLWAVGLLDHVLRPDATPSRWPEAEVEAAHEVRRIVTALADLDAVSSGTDAVAFRVAVEAALTGTALDTGDLSDGGLGDGVFVGPYESVAGLQFHTVVVTGLAEAHMPGPTDGGLLGDDLRLLDRSGALFTPAQRRERRRRVLARAVASGSDRRVVTFPRGDPRTGRAHVPSPWLGAFIDTETPWHAVDSFAAGLAGAEPALTAREFDLRALDAWVRAGGDAAHGDGGGRLTRGFDARRARLSVGFSRYDGAVGPGRVSAFDAATPVSATRFETYATCPRRYLFGRVLRVRPRVRPEELWRIEPTTRGTLVHRILESYVAERVQGAVRSLDRLLTIATALLDEAELGGLVGKTLLWRLDRTAILRDLSRFHEEEGDIEPVAAEHSFGTGADDGGPPVVVALGDGRSVAFQGSIDRVDRTMSGRLLVSDYKTGRQGRLTDLTRDPVAAGRLLQLPLYALAAQDRFGGDGPVHARYWLLSGDRSAPCFHLVVTDEVQARFRDVVGTIADGVDAGSFPAVPGMPISGSFTHCTGCDFDSVCPPSRDRQWGRLWSAPSLRGVVALVSGDTPEGLSGSVVKRFVDPDDDPAP